MPSWSLVAHRGMGTLGFTGISYRWRHWEHGYWFIRDWEHRIERSRADDKPFIGQLYPCLPCVPR